MAAIKTICPIIDTNLQHRDVHLVSPANNTMRQWVSTSYSNSVATFSMPPPSTSVFIDRCFLKKTPVVITVAGSTSGGAMLQGGYDALRSYPIANITVNDALTLNNQTFSSQVSERVPYMARYWEQSKFSSFPSMLDNYAEYADGVGAVNNPLAPYFNSIDHHQTRGGYPMMIVNGDTSATITADVYEPIWIPCLHKEFGMGVGFTNIKSCDYVCNYASNLARIFSHALSSATISGVSVALGQPIIYQLYSTPPIGQVPMKMIYSSEDVNHFPTARGSSLAAGAAVSAFPSTNMQLNAVPRWILVFVRESNANLTYAKTDTACRIDNISAQFNNQSGILSSASCHDLWDISVANGLQSTWEEWYGQTSQLTRQIGLSGSYLKLFFGRDIPLNGAQVGQVGAFNLQMNVSYTNVNQTSAITNPTLYIITSTAQKLTIDVDGLITTTLGLDMNEEGEYVPYEGAMQYYGGSFGSFIRSIGRFLKRHKIISKFTKFIPVVGQTVSDIADKEGYGHGGKSISNAELMKRIRKYK